MHQRLAGRQKGRRNTDMQIIQPCQGHVYTSVVR